MIEPVDQFMGKLIVFTAPSGAGKTTIVKHLLNQFPKLAFSVSATTRNKRDGEIEGKDYYFLAAERFRELIKAGAFVEWEEVYPDQFYGTLRSEIERIWKKGKVILFDIDVRGALNLRREYGRKCLTVFVKPPSLEVHLQRLRTRRTESEEALKIRIAKVEKEMAFEECFDVTLVNDELAYALSIAETIVEDFINEKNMNQ